MTKDELQELDWLRYFYDHARHGMGPAYSDIYAMIKESYVDDGGELPQQYKEEE